MPFKQYLLGILFPLFWIVPVVGSESVEIEKLPKMGEGILFPDHLIIKVSDEINFRDFDNDTEEYSINFNHLLVNDLEDIPQLFLDRIPAMTVLKKETVHFKSMIKNDYSFSKKWTDENHIVSIKNFEKTGSDTGLSTLLGPLSNIPTSWRGIATYALKFGDSTVQFKSFASKKSFTFKNIYWAYLDVFLSPPEYANQVNVLILLVSEPNNFLKDNGTYFLIPFSKDDRKRYSIQ
jgi:hypothetical protein